MRRGIAELNGAGEVAGGVIIMRSGKNALATINAVGGFVVTDRMLEMFKGRSRR